MENGYVQLITPMVSSYYKKKPCKKCVLTVCAVSKLQFRIDNVNTKV